MYYGNDRITELFDGIYIGGIENNVRRTLPLVDVWINFAHDSKTEKKIKEKTKSDYVYHPLRFDDGDLYKGQEKWLKAYEIINLNKEKKILISCTEGVSRSAVMCLWILCEKLGDYEEAFHYLKKKRKVYIDTNFEPFVSYLKETYKCEK